mgnify:CR=1 FL=1
MKRKKGSHVGFVISFVLFITFVVFMYAIISSRATVGQEKANSLDYVKEEITKRVSANLAEVSVSIGAQNPQSCVQLTNFFSKTGLGDRFFALDDSENILQTGKGGNDLFVQRNGNLFFRVYGSGEFNVSGGAVTGCQSLNEGPNGYILGLSRDSKEIFETRVLTLFENYTGNYETLKGEMKISSSDEFGFRFVYNNGTEIRTPERNLTTNIYAERVPVQYIKSNAKRESGFLDSIVW